MPELPDVESFKNYFESRFIGVKVADLKVLNKKILGNISGKKLREKITGSKFKSTSRYGKYLFTETGDGSFLVYHFGMTGSFKCFRDRHKIPPHTRMILTFHNNTCLAYKCMRMFGRIYVTDSVENFINSKNIGPDALEVKKDVFLKAVKKRKAKIKSLLLNQSFIAGLGNIYADEVLFQSGVYPGKRSDLIDDRKLNKIYGNIQKVLKTAIKFNAEADKFPESYLIKNRTGDSNCPGCNAKIKRMEISGRGTYFCPRCQKE